MMKQRMKLLAALLLLNGLSAGVPVTAGRTQPDTVSENIQRLEEQKAGEEARMDLLAQSQSLLYQELGELDKHLSELAKSLTETEESQKRLSSELELLQKEREEVRVKEQEYYEGMKKRIRFFYENGEEDMLILLLQAEGFGDAWNRIIYITGLYELDRNMLAEYQRMYEDISWKEEKIEQERQEAAALGQALYESRAEAQNLITEMKMSLLNTENMLAEAGVHAGEYEALIAVQRAYERELEAERERAEEENREKWEAFQAEERPAAVYSPLENDLDLLAAIIECEAGGESREGKLAVGSVVINRIHSPHFPNSLVEVLYQDRQFTPVGSGRFAVVLARGADSDCYEAAAEVLAGKRTLDCLFFRTNNGSKEGIVIGNHVFY